MNKNAKVIELFPEEEVKPIPYGKQDRIVRILLYLKEVKNNGTHLF